MTTDEGSDETTEAAVHDEAWFAALFAAHATPLYRYFRRRLPSAVGVAPDADDLTAEVLATAWRRRDDVPDGAELPWLYRTAGFLLANHRRKARALPVAEVPERPDDGADVEHVVVQDDEVRRALGALSDRDRRILLLHAWEGLGGAELAAVLGTSRGGADAALSRGSCPSAGGVGGAGGARARDRRLSTHHG